MKSSNRELAQQFVRWWSDPDYRARHPNLLSTDVEYEQTGGFTGEAALWYVNQLLPWDDLQYDILRITTEHVFIEGFGTDPITLLPHKRTWALTIKDGAIRSVVETAEVVRSKENP